MHLLMKYAVYLLCAMVLSNNIFAQDYLSGLSQKFDNNDHKKSFTDSITISTAVITALQNNPEVKDAYKEIDALDKIIIQQGLTPNPELGIEVENIFGSGPFAGVKGSEITAAVSQDIMLAGNISKQQNVARLEADLAYYDYELKRLEVITNVRKAFNDVVKTQTLLHKQEELLENTSEFVKNVKRRNVQGAVSSIEVIRADLVYNKLELEHKATGQQLKSIKKNLSVLMGIDEIQTNIFSNYFQLPKTLPALEKLIAEQQSNPAIAKNNIVKQRDNAKIIYEESLAIPDLSVSAGFRRMNDSEENTFLVGVSMRIPVSNTNQGNIAEAKIRMDQNKIRNESLIKNLEGRLTEFYNEAVSYQNSITSYREVLLPRAKETLESIKEGYSQGRYKILDVIDSQNTLIDIEINYIEVESAYRNTIYEIENLIATGIENVN